MNKTFTIKDIILAAVFIMAAWAFISSFKGCGVKTPDPTDRLKDKQEIIDMVVEDRNYWRGKYDEVIGEIKYKDSLLQLKDKTTIVKYEKIPVVIRGYSNEELRRAVTEYK